MIDHVVLNVKDLEASRRFFVTALEPVGYSVTAEFPGMVGLGDTRATDLWLVDRGEPITVVHAAFRSPDRKTVDRFHVAALAAGGADNGAPGSREIYHPHYYGAFVLDPDGNNIEVVCHSSVY